MQLIALVIKPESSAVKKLTVVARSLPRTARSLCMLVAANVALVSHQDNHLKLF